MAPDGRAFVDAVKLTRRIAPGLIQMIDAAFAAAVVKLLNDAGVRDVTSIHDAFLVPRSQEAELVEVLGVPGKSPGRVGPLWLPMLETVYDFFEGYLPDGYVHELNVGTKARPVSRRVEAGDTVRAWRKAWERRLADCRAVRVAWPVFRTKSEGATFERSERSD
jgi:hypothetical protein